MAGKMGPRRVNPREQAVALVSAIVSVVGVVISLVWLQHWLRMILLAKPVPRMEEFGLEEPAGGWPALDIIVPARNEGDTIGPAMRSLLDQDYPDFRVIGVDDRSEDATGVILDGLSGEDARLTVLHVGALPPGWLGKCHALQAGSSAGQAAWVLMTDADVHYAQSALMRALSFAVQQRADHVAATPAVITETLGERIFLAIFLAAFSVKAPRWKIEDPDCREALGIGAFNLVRREAFTNIGGLTQLSLSVDEDLRFAEAIKAAGYRTRILDGTGALAVRWQVGLGGMIRGLEKNIFAVLNFNLPRAVAAILLMLVGGLSPYLGLLVGPIWARGVCLAGIVAIGGILQIVGKMDSIHWGYALLFPLSTIIMAFTLARSTALVLIRGGVRWRDHTYPLRELRDHAHARDAWIRKVWASTR